jgi:adenine-specific DNA methylase
MPIDQRLIEVYIPGEAVSAGVRREKSIRKGDISTLQLWWAWRALAAARAVFDGVLPAAPALYPTIPDLAAQNNHSKKSSWRLNPYRLSAGRFKTSGGQSAA